MDHTLWQTYKITSSKSRMCALRLPAISFATQTKEQNVLLKTLKKTHNIARNTHSPIYHGIESLAIFLHTNRTTPNSTLKCTFQQIKKLNQFLRNQFPTENRRNNPNPKAGKTRHRSRQLPADQPPEHY